MASGEVEEEGAEQAMTELLLGELGSEEAARWTARLAEDPDLQLARGELGDTVGLLQQSIEQLPVQPRSAAQRAALESAIAGEAAVEPSPEQQPAPPPTVDETSPEQHDDDDGTPVPLAPLINRYPGAVWLGTGVVAAAATLVLVVMSPDGQMVTVETEEASAETVVLQRQTAASAPVPPAAPVAEAAPVIVAAPPRAAAPSPPQAPPKRAARAMARKSAHRRPSAAPLRTAPPSYNRAPSEAPAGRRQARAKARAKAKAEPFMRFDSPASPAAAATPPVQQRAASAVVAEPTPKPLHAYERAQALLPDASDAGFVNAEAQPKSTFAADTDTASYALLRQTLKNGQRPAAGGVRVEEMLNYFDYGYPQPTGKHPIAIHTEVASAPWDPSRRLLRIGIQARNERVKRGRNLVVVVDSSGSMARPQRLPLLKESLGKLVGDLGRKDRIAIVAYSDMATVVLEPTEGHRHSTIRAALNGLTAGGSTNGSDALEVAYRLAERSLIPGANNRVLLATDGAFNRGATDQRSLTSMIQRLARSGVFLSVLGFGREAAGDATLENLANRGNGTYAFIDSRHEAHRALRHEASSTLVTVAKDVKFQLAFDPAVVRSYRRVGYHNRAMANAAFADDLEDGGELGAGVDVTVFYEVVLQPSASVAKGKRARDLATVHLRYKSPSGTSGRQLEAPVVDRGGVWEEASPQFRFAAAVAEFGMILNEVSGAPLASHGRVLEMAAGAMGEDPHGYRKQFLELVRLSRGVRP